MLKESDLLCHDAEDKADDILVDSATGQIRKPERKERYDTGLRQKDERCLILLRKSRDELLLGRLICSGLLEYDPLPLDRAIVVSLPEPSRLTAEEERSQRIADDALDRDDDRGKDASELEGIRRTHGGDRIVYDDCGYPASRDRSDEGNREVVAEDRAGDEEHQDTADDDDSQSKHDDLPLVDEGLEVKQRTHVDDEETRHHRGDLHQTRVGEERRRH